MALEGSEWRMKGIGEDAKGCRFLVSDKNGLKLIVVMAAQLCEYIFKIPLDWVYFISD